jgi:hypothetical protein
VTQWLYPGNQTAGIIAVGAVIALSVLAVAIAAIQIGGREPAGG